MVRRSASLGLLAMTALVSGCAWLGAAPPLAPPSDEPRLSRAAFVERAESACATRKRALAALPRPSTKRQRGSFFGQVAAIQRVELTSFVKLRPPRALEPEFTSLLQASGELTQIATRFHRAVVRDDAHARRRALADAERASAAYDRAAKQLKLACRQTV